MTVETDSGAIARGLPDITTEHGPFPVTGELHITVMRKGDMYVINAPGYHNLRLNDSLLTIVSVHDIINSVVIGTMRDHICLHSASFTIGGKSFIAVGDKKSGKTTLSCKLLLEKALIHSDEYALILDGEFVPFPKKIHIKEGTLDVLPEMRKICSSLTLYPSVFGWFFYFFSPTYVGSEWPISRGKADYLVYIDPVHEGPSSIEPCSEFTMFNKVMPQIHKFPEKSAGQVRRIGEFIQSAPCYTLRFGEPKGIADLLRSIIHG
ncbi:hypothetical protein ACFL6B_01190 [Thermodesulfobacteriota bacterium]